VTTLDTIKDRYEAVKDRIARAAERTGRRGEDICLVAVTKYVGVEEIRELVQLGHRDFGENLVQQLVQRTAMIGEWQARQRAHPALGPALVNDPIRWHMIGHLQRNKARKAAELCRLIHSVDSLRLAEELQAIGLKLDRPVDMLLQVNTSGEASKFGCAPGAARHLAEQFESMANLRLRGLMTMAPHSENPDEARPTFARLRELYEEIRSMGVGGGKRGHFNILSMGMSGDFEAAIDEGANLVRVGSALFGDSPAGHDQADHDAPNA
jgi:pyridoxal phosphate enzyme (YggS family)